MPAVCLSTTGDAGIGTSVERVIPNAVKRHGHRDEIVIVEDVVRSGKSALKIVQACRKAFGVVPGLRPSTRNEK